MYSVANSLRLVRCTRCGEHGYYGVYMCSVKLCSYNLKRTIVKVRIKGSDSYVGLSIAVLIKRLSLFSYLGERNVWEPGPA